MFAVSSEAASYLAAQLASVMGAEVVVAAQVGAALRMECTLDGGQLLAGSGDIYRDRNVTYMGAARKADGFGSMLCRRSGDSMRNAGMRLSKGRNGSTIAPHCDIRKCEFHRHCLYGRMPSGTFTAA